MPAIELRQDEIGFYDPEAAKARRERLWGKPKVNLAIVRPPKPKVVTPAPVDESMASYAEKDQTFDLGLFGAFPPRRINRNITVREIISITARTYNMPMTIFLSNRRSRDIVRARQEAMWMAHRFTKRSLPDIGRQFGGKDHTTVLHSIRQMKRLVGSGEYEPRALAHVEGAIQEINRYFEVEHDAASAAIAAE
jgi:hypothetical protein